MKDNRWILVYWASLLAILVFAALPARQALAGEPVKIVEVALDKTGDFYITTDKTHNHALTLFNDSPARELVVDRHQRQFRRFLDPIAGGEVRLELGADNGYLVIDHPARGEELNLAISYDDSSGAVTLKAASDVQLSSVDIRGPLTIQLDGNAGKVLTMGSLTAQAIIILGGDEADRLIFNGPVHTTQDVTITSEGVVIINAPIYAVGGFESNSRVFNLNTTAIQVRAGAASIQARDQLTLRESQLHVAGGLSLVAVDTLHIRDSGQHAFVVEAGGKLSMRGDQAVDIFALNHPDSALISGGDMVLQSVNPIKGDVHYLAGGKFSIEQLDGQAGDLISPYDPIVFAGGDVSLGDYTGAALHILAGGSVTLNSAVITGTDTTANTVNPANTATFNGSDQISSLAGFNLSNGAGVVVDGSLTPTLDIRAGIDWTTFTGGAPANQVIPAGTISPVFGGATGAAITVTGVISIAQPDGMVLLSNQYRPNGLTGNISTGNIDTSTTISGTNAGSITIDSKGDLSTGALDAYALVAGTLLTAGDGGPITLLAPNGSVASAGNLSAYTRTPVNSSGSVGDGGPVVIEAGGNITVDGGNGAIESLASSNSDSDAGRGGDVTVETSQGNIDLGYINSYAFAPFSGSTGGGGTIALSTDDGSISVNGGFFDSLQSWATDGQGGTVTVTATSGIFVAKNVEVRGGGSDNDSGSVGMLTDSGNITTGDISAIAVVVGAGISPGNGGDVTLQALNGGITTGDIDTFSNALFLNNPSKNGGNVTLRALNGNVVTGQIQTYSEARGALGSAGDAGLIDIVANNGSITGSGNLQAYARSATNNSNSNDAGNGGPISLQATNDIDIAGQLNSYALSQVFNGRPPVAAAGNGGTIVLTSTTGSISTSDMNSYSSASSVSSSGGDILVLAATGVDFNSGNGVLNSYTRVFTSGIGTAGNGGNVVVDVTSGNIDLSEINSYAWATFAGSAGNAGNITLTTGNGSISVSGGFFNALNASVGAAQQAGDGGNIILDATQGITIGDRTAAGVIGIDGNGGNISLTTTDGNVTTDVLLAHTIYGSVGSPGNGGNVTVQALNGTVVISDVWTFSRALLIHNPARNGGNITLEALNGDAVFNNLWAYSEARGEFGHTGNAGRIEVTANNGNITSTGTSIRTDSFSSINNGRSGIVGNGNDIVMQTTNNINLAGGLWSFARSSDQFGNPTPTGSAGNAGDVFLSGNNVDLSYIDARSAAVGSIGSGGAVVITATQFVRGTGALLGSADTISSQGLANSSAITITHGGGGITPFIVGNAATNGTSGVLNTGDTSISPVNSYLYTHFEPPNIWIISAPVPLTLTKTANPDIDAPYRGEISYTVTLSNPGSVEATNVLVTDTLPTEVDFARWAQQPAGAVVTNDQITWAGPVPVNGQVIFTFVVSHTGDYGDVFTNTAEFSHSESINSGTASAAVTIEQLPGLTISKTASLDTDMAYRGLVTYTVDLSNSGSTPANGVLLTDTLPSEVDFDRWVQQSGAGEVADQITWNGAVPANGNVTFSFVVSHTGDYGDVFTNTAEFFHLPSDSGGTDTAVVTVIGPPILSISKMANPNTNVPYRGEVTYTVVLSNDGAADANGVLLTDTLPSEVDFSRWVQQSGASVVADQITWNGTVPANSSVIFSFVGNHVGDYGDVVINTAEYSFVAGGGVTGNADATFTVEPDPTGSPLAGSIYLPLIMKAVSPPPPDLVVDSLVASSNGVTVVIKNVGPGPVVDAFWVDVYLDPDTPPTQVNQHWFDLGDEGIVWGVTALPIDPGETLTLTIGDVHYVGPPTSQFSLPLVVGSPIYAQVDSVNLLTNYGGVLESHEITSGAYNNITGTIVTAASSSAALPATANGEKALSDMLPPR